MASTQATIDLVVRGSGAVNRLIENVNQLQSAVDRINSRTLDVASKGLGDQARDLAKAVKDIGTARDSRPEVASRVTELTRRETQATREYARAVSSQSRALAGAVRAEEQLAERRQRRTRVDSNAEREIVDRLNRNVAAYRAAEGEVSQLLGRFRSLSREFAAIGRMNAEARIPLIGQQINLNQTIALQRSIRALAEEFNRLGDSARSSDEENRLSRTDLPNQIRNFGQLSDQLAETRARAQALREELVAIGRNERLVQAPAASPIILGGSQSAAEIIQAFRNQPSEIGIGRQNQEIAERNRARQRRRSEIRAELSQQNTLIGQIEAEAITAGEAVFALQGKLADLVEFRYRDEPAAGRRISLNQIQAQAESLALVANNSEIASDAFRQYTVAAEMASIKLARSQQATFEALAAGLSTTGGVNIPEGLRKPELVAGARGMVAQLIADIPNLTRSEAALGAHIQLLNQVRTLLPFLSLEYRAVEEAIAGLNEELQGVGLRGQASKIDPGAGQRLLRQREREENARQRGITAVNRLVERQADIERRINESRFSAAEKDDLRLKNEEAFTRLANNELEAAKRLTSELERQVTAKEKLLKSKPAQIFGVEGFEFNPVTGKSKTGVITPGSPAAKDYIAEIQNNSLKLWQSQERLAQKRQGAAGKLFEKQADIAKWIDESKFLATEKDQLRLRLEEAFARLSNDQLESATGLTREIEKQVIAKEKLLKSKPAQIFGIEGFAFSPVTGKSKTGAITPGSPADQEELAKEQNKAFAAREKKEEDALKALIKYTQEAERNAQKLQASYDRLDLTQALDEYLADIANVENATASLLKKLSTIPGTGESALKNFDKRLQAAIEGRQAGGQLSSQLLMLEKLQKRMLELEIDGVDVAKNKATVEKLIEDIKSGQVSASKQSVDFVGKELRDARLRLGISQSQAKIDGKIADALKGAVGGPSKKINDLAAQQKYAAQINDEYQKMEGLLAKIGGSTISDTQKLQLSFNVDQAINELYNNRLESAQLITREVEKQFAAEQRLEGRAQSQAEETQKAFYQIEAQQRRLTTLQLEYNKEEGRGVTFLNEKVQLAATLERLSQGQVEISLATSEALGRDIKLFSDLKRQRVLEAQAAGEYQISKKPATAEQLERRRERILKLAMSGASQLIDLEKKGVVVANERSEIEQTINDLQAIRNKASEQELVTLAQKVQAARNFASAMALDLRAGAIPGAGLQAALQQLQAAREARQEFLGTMSPAEGIDKIVREFNAGKAGGSDPGDLVRRATEAAQQGPEALLSLKELAEPAKVSTKELEALSAILKEFRSVLDPTIQGFDRLDDQLRETAANLDLQLERRAPDANFLTSRVGPRTANAISEGLIGGAFPLLFGQGLGSSIGGGLGGALGGFAGGGLGFGLSLVGTALGSAFDTFNNNLKELAKSLKDPTASLEAMKTAGLSVGSALEFYVKELEASGRTAEAQRVVFSELERQLGGGSVRQLQALNTEQKELEKQWQALASALTSELLPAILGTVTFVNDAISGFKSLGSIQLPDWLRAGVDRARGAQAAITKAVPTLGLLGPAGLAGVFYRNTVQAGRQRAQQEGPTLPDLTFEKQKAGLQAQRQAADEIKSAYREGFQLQQRIIDFERKAVDIRRRIEDEIFNKRQQIARQQIDNDRKRAQIAIEAVDLEYRKRIANEEGRAAEVLAAEAELMKTRAEGEAEIAAAKKLLELDIAKQQRESQNYIFNLSREADSIRRETLSLEMEVADYREEIERKIQDKRLIVAAGEKAAAEQAGGRGAAAARAGNVPDLNAGMAGANWPAGVPRPGTPTMSMTRNGRPIWAGAPRQVIEYYTGDPAMRGTPAYDPKGHGGAKYHEHLAFSSVEAKNIAIEALRGAGLVIGSQYRPGDPGFHGANLAIDVPAYPNFARKGFPDNSKGEQMLGALVRRTVEQAFGGSLATPIAQLEDARSQARKPRPVIPSIPFERGASAALALDAQDNRLKRESVGLEEKLAKLKEQGALQRLYEAARGPIEIKQRKEAVSLAKAELAVIGPMSQDKQEAALFEAQALEKLKNRAETDKDILRTTKLQGEEKKKLEEVLVQGLLNTQRQIELDREALGIAQQRRFLEERSALQQRLAFTGVAEGAGFFGAGASAYTAELLRSGNAGQAAELAKLARAQEVKQAVADIRGELNSLMDPTNQVIAAAGAIGGAFSESFRGVISGSMSAQEALANFFQRTADHFLDMAAQMIAKMITLSILNQVTRVLPGGGGGAGLSNLGAPGNINNPLGVIDFFNVPKAANGAAFGGSITPFANGGAFTNSIVSSPTLFKFADGGAMRTGLMGEAGSEAIMPLTRGPGGRLGVDASGVGSGGGDVSVTVNVDARGTSVEGDQQQAAAFGRAISAVVQAEIVKQKRPGGLLSR